MAVVPISALEKTALGAVFLFSGTLARGDCHARLARRWVMYFLGCFGGSVTRSAQFSEPVLVVVCEAVGLVVDLRRRHRCCHRSLLATVESKKERTGGTLPSLTRSAQVPRRCKTRSAQCNFWGDDSVSILFDAEALVDTEWNSATVVHAPVERFVRKRARRSPLNEWGNAQRFLFGCCIIILLNLRLPRQPQTFALAKQPVPRLGAYWRRSCSSSSSPSPYYS